MGTDPFVKTWWFLEGYDGSWLADVDDELFTRDPNQALKWPNRTRADYARSAGAMHHALWLKIKGPTEHVWLPPAESGAVDDGDGVPVHSLSATDEQINPPPNLEGK